MATHHRPDAVGDEEFVGGLTSMVWLEDLSAIG